MWDIPCYTTEKLQTSCGYLFVEDEEFFFNNRVKQPLIYIKILSAVLSIIRPYRTWSLPFTAVINQRFSEVLLRPSHLIGRKNSSYSVRLSLWYNSYRHMMQARVLWRRFMYLSVTEVDYFKIFYAMSRFSKTCLPHSSNRERGKFKKIKHFKGCQGEMERRSLSIRLRVYWSTRDF